MEKADVRLARAGRGRPASSASCSAVLAPLYSFRPRLAWYCVQLLSTLGQSLINCVKLAILASRLSRWCSATASSVIGSFELPYSYSPWWLIIMCLISVTSDLGNRSPESRSASATLSSIIEIARIMWPSSWPSSV